MESYDYKINAILDTVRKTKDKFCEFSGIESVAQEKTNNSLKICNDMLQEIWATSTVIKEEMRVYFTNAYELRGKRTTLSASTASVLYHDFIRDMLLKEKLEIFDIPFQIRSSTDSLYITACRVCRHYGSERYKAVLELLNDDLLLVSETDKLRLTNLYHSLKENARLSENTGQDNSDSNTND